jgi:hypothetical protein
MPSPHDDQFSRFFSTKTSADVAGTMAFLSRGAA